MLCWLTIVGIASVKFCVLVDVPHLLCCTHYCTREHGWQALNWIGINRICHQEGTAGVLIENQIYICGFTSANYVFLFQDSDLPLSTCSNYTRTSCRWASACSLAWRQPLIALAIEIFTLFVRILPSAILPVPEWTICLHMFEPDMDQPQCAGFGCWSWS